MDKFMNDNVKALCEDHAFDCDVPMVQNNVKYLYWETDNTQYVAAFSDAEHVDGTTEDVRFFRIWSREHSERPDSEWKFLMNDFLFGATMQYPLAMFIEEINDKDKVHLSLEINEWQFETVLGRFER